MRPLSSALLAAYALPVTRPLWLVLIEFSPALRLCSFGDVSWDGAAWASFGVEVEGLSGGASAQPRLVLDDADRLASALAFGQGVSERRIAVWEASADALAADDPVCVFDGTGGDAVKNPDTGLLTIGLRARQARPLPRGRLTPARGVSLYSPAGSSYEVNGERFVLTEGY